MVGQETDKLARTRWERMEGGESGLSWVVPDFLRRATEEDSRAKQTMAVLNVRNEV